MHTGDHACFSCVSAHSEMAAAAVAAGLTHPTPVTRSSPVLIWPASAYVLPLPLQLRYGEDGMDPVAMEGKSGEPVMFSRVLSVSGLGRMVVSVCLFGWVGGWMARGRDVVVVPAQLVVLPHTVPA